MKTNLLQNWGVKAIHGHSKRERRQHSLPSSSRAGHDQLENKKKTFQEKKNV